MPSSRATKENIANISSPEGSSGFLTAKTHYVCHRVSEKYLQELHLPTDPVLLLRDKRVRLLVEILVVLSIGFAVATHPAKVTAPSLSPQGGGETTTAYYPIPCYQSTYTTYRATVDSIAADQQSYAPGSVITFSGKVELQSYTYTEDSCGFCYGGSGWSPADPSTAQVYIELWVHNDWKAVSGYANPDSNGNFAVSWQVPESQSLGTISLRVTASPIPSEIWYGGCSPIEYPDQALGHKGTNISIQLLPPSISLTVTPPNGCAPFAPNMNYTLSGGKTPYTVIVHYGDGASLDVSPGKPWPAHVYNMSGTFTVQITATDANGKTSSDSKTITVCQTPVATSTTPETTSSSTSSTAPAGPPPVCDPGTNIFLVIVAVLITIVIVLILRRWIVGLFPWAEIVIPIILAIIIAAIIILPNPNACAPVITLLLVAILVAVIILIFRGRILGPGRRGPPGFPPGGGGNVTGNATQTQPNGKTTQLTNKNVNKISRGSTVETDNNSYVRMSTPQGSNSHTIVGQGSKIGWLDPNGTPQIPWLRFPGFSQIYDTGSVLLRLDYGKLLINWVESPAAQEAVIALPVGLIGVGAAAAMNRWLARIKGTMVLVEANQNGTAAAITVLDSNDTARQSSVEIWRSDEQKLIQIQAGERLILRTGYPPAKVKVNTPPGLGAQIDDPFGAFHKWWALAPMSDETIGALSGATQGFTGASTDEGNVFCAQCGTKLPATARFCTKCGHERSP